MYYLNGIMAGSGNGSLSDSTATLQMSRN